MNCRRSQKNISDSDLAAVSVPLCQKYYREITGEVPGRTELRADRNVQLQNNRGGPNKAGPDSRWLQRYRCVSHALPGWKICEAMTVMALPAELRRFCRTSNHIERLNRELKRRFSVIGIFPNEESLVRTMGTVLIEESHQRQSGRAISVPKLLRSLWHRKS